MRARHLEALAVLRARVGGGAELPGPAPLVLAHCGEAFDPRATAGARLGAEVVRVRVDGAAALATATSLVRGALRFAGEVGDLRGPRGGPLAALGPPPMQIDASSCPGSARCRTCVECCPARALRPGDGGGPVAAAGACTSCGECVARCPRGALGHAHAPWSALNARLEALLEDGGGGPWTLVLSEATGPPPPDRPRETSQPVVPGIVPMELPPGTLRAGVVLRALELGAATVCAVAPDEDGACREGVLAAQALARAAGEGARIRIARSREEAIAAAGGSSPPAPPAPERVAREPARRPDAAAIALSMWRRHVPLAPRRVSGRGVPGGVAAVDGEACTFCGLCLAACPTGALTLHRERVVTLRFDPALCPLPCGQCQAACPSRALTLSPELHLPPEPLTLVARAGICARCGGLWPEAATVAALGRKMAAGGKPAALLRFVSWCPECRTRALGAALRDGETGSRPAPGR